MSVAHLHIHRVVWQTRISKVSKRHAASHVPSLLQCVKRMKTEFQLPYLNASVSHRVPRLRPKSRDLPDIKAEPLAGGNCSAAPAVSERQIEYFAWQSHPRASAAFCKMNRSQAIALSPSMAAMWLAGWRRRRCASCALGPSPRGRGGA